MEMNFGHWMALESAMQSDRPRRPVSAATLRRIAAFARPHRRKLVWFLMFSVVGAVLTVATPVLAGQVVNEIVNDGSSTTIVALAVAIAVVALGQAVISIGERWESARIGEGLILDLRRSVFGHVQRMPVAFFMRTRTGRAGEPAQQRRDRRPAGIHWTLSGVVSNAISLLLALVVMLRLSWQITLLSLCCCRSS